METGAATTAAPSSAADGDETQTKIVDPITSLQDAIDGLSLAMFESLRSLRDAVAPESGNLGVAPNQNGNGGNSAEPDDLWHSYKQGDQKVRDMIHQGNPNHPPIQKREDFVRLHAKLEMQKDTELVFRLAQTVLSKSQDIDDQVGSLPFMNSTREEQMNRIQHLLQDNEAVKQELQDTYSKALARRNECRRAIKENTSKALGITEEKI